MIVKFLKEKEKDTNNLIKKKLVQKLNLLNGISPINKYIKA